MQALVAEEDVRPSASVTQPRGSVDRGRVALLPVARRFGGDRRGVMAVEFALVAFPLCILIFALIEIGLIYWISATLDNGIDASMRQFYVQGEASSRTLSEGVRGELCRQMSPFVRCENLKVDIAAYERFADIDRTNPVDASTGTWRAGFGDQHGCLTKGSIVVVQAALAQQTFQNFGIVTNPFRDGSQLILATAILQLDGNAPRSAGC